jgi:hypothetical protein
VEVLIGSLERNREFVLHLKCKSLREVSEIRVWKNFQEELGINKSEYIILAA